MYASRKHVWMALAVSAAAAGCPVTAAAIEVAENLLISLDAADLSSGPLSSWMSTGSLGGVFTNDPLAPVSNVLVAPVGGVERAVVFTGNDAMVSDVIAPSGVTGIDPTRSIEVWAYNPGVGGEEVMVSWSRRGGPVGSAMQFNFGNNGAFGAVTHWGAPDIGWGPGGAPSARQWHHLTYTFDGPTATTRVYIDGVEANNEVLAPGTINTPGDFYPFRLGAALAGNEANLEIWGSLALAKVRVHDGVLTAEQIMTNFSEERSVFEMPPPPPPQPRPLRADPIHRYSFEGTGGDGAVLNDSIGTAHGVLRTFDGVSSLTGTGQMFLAGGASDTAGYGDLPNNLISVLSEVTLEAWVTPTGAQNWMRVADFGTTTEGEHTQPGGGGTGQESFFMSATRGGNINQQRAEIGFFDENGVLTINTADANVPTTLDEEHHYVVVYSETSEFGVPEIRFYLDGELRSSANTEVRLSDIDDVNNWLGRSNYTGDMNFQGLFEEFRIYDYALTDDEVLGNFQAGPFVINVGGPPTESAWNVDADGDWAQAANWMGGVPNAPGASASFGDVITASRTITLGETFTVGSLQFDNANTYTLGGSGGLVLDANGAGGASIRVDSGSHVINVPVEARSNTNINIAADSTLTIEQPLSAPGVNITKSGAGTAHAAHVSAGALTIDEGLLHLLSGGATASSAGSLSIAGGATPTATLDLDNNSLVIGAGDLAEVEAWIASGRNAGAWDGPGITSSVAAADLNRITGLAVMLNSDTSGNPIFTEFDGVAVDADSILVTLTWNGDMDLNRMVDIDDYFLIDTGFLAFQAGLIENPTYRQGDLNFDDLVDIDDYFLIDTAFLGQTAGLSVAAVAVPEPGIMGLLGGTVLGLLARRRRRNGQGPECIRPARN